MKMKSDDKVVKNKTGRRCCRMYDTNIKQIIIILLVKIFQHQRKITLNIII